MEKLAFTHEVCTLWRANSIHSWWTLMLFCNNVAESIQFWYQSRKESLTFSLLPLGKSARFWRLRKNKSTPASRKIHLLVSLNSAPTTYLHSALTTLRLPLSTDLRLSLWTLFLIIDCLFVINTDCLWTQHRRSMCTPHRLSECLFVLNIPTVTSHSAQTVFL